MGFRSRTPQHEYCRKISHKLRPSDMETISEVVYWAVLLYAPIYWFIGLIVLGGCFIAGTIWSTLACSFRPQTPLDVQKIVGNQPGGIIFLASCRWFESLS
jgi:hypothetical protein